MADKKSRKRTFEMDLRMLPVELVPPDPAKTERPLRQRQPSAQVNPAADAERGVVDRLIDRIKRI
jgi:hypothetical protein